MLARKGQYIIEYAILITIVTAALSAMTLYLRRAVQGQTKLIDDEFSESNEDWREVE